MLCSAHRLPWLGLLGGALGGLSSRRLRALTVKLDAAISRAAAMGPSSPAAATAMPTVL